MWCEQNKKRTRNAVSHLEVNLPCTVMIPTERLGYVVVGAGRWLLVQGRPRVRIPALKGKTIANFSLTLPFTAARSRFRHPDFLGRCSWECTAFPGSLVYCRPPWLRSMQYCCFTITLFSFLAFRCCSAGGSSVVSETARWRWAWLVLTRWARRPSMFTL